MPRLITAIRTIHADREWWRKVLVGGALWLSIIGWPIVEGHQLESLENSQRGFPTPLPFWQAPGNKAVVGFFALVIDFFHFVFPLLIGGVLFFCVTIGVGLSGGGEIVRLVGMVVLGLTGLYLLLTWLTGISAIAKQRYVLQGDMQEALSLGVVREQLRAPARRPYLQARLHSIPPYVVALALLSLAVLVLGRSTIAGLVLLWLGLSALVYARLVAIQLFLAATREVERLRFDRISRKAET